MANFKVKDISKLNYLLRRAGLSEIPPKYNTTQAIINEIVERGELKLFIMNLIADELRQQLNDSEGPLIDRILLQREQLIKKTRLNFPVALPQKKGAFYLLSFSFLLAYSLLFYFLFWHPTSAIPIFMVFSIGMGTIAALFFWRLLLLIFNNLGKETFMGVRTEDELLSEMYRLNKKHFCDNQFEVLNEKIYQLTNNSSFS